MTQTTSAACRGASRAPAAARRRCLTGALAVIGLALAAVAVAGPSSAASSLPTSVTTRTTSVGVTAKLEYCGNGQMEDVNTAVSTVVVVIHGTGREACSYAKSTLRAASSAGVASSTLVLAPHFLSESDSHTGRLFWSSSGWKVGDASKDKSRMSSFAVVDHVLAGITKSRYPNLRRVVVAGHSAGGQFVNRYESASPREGVDRYVVANPSSYLYLGPKRVVGTGTRNLTESERLACPDFNEYKYGLQERNDYVGAVPISTMRGRLVQRPTTLLLGTLDTLQDSDLDTSCAAKWQGSNRYERGHRYHDIHLPSEFGGQVHLMNSLVDVPAVGHTWSGIARSPQGRAALFGTVPAS